MPFYKVSLFTCLLFLAIGLYSCNDEASTDEFLMEEIIPNEDGIAFFNLVNSLCGQTYSGLTTYPTDSSHLLTGARLQITIETCTENEVRIPFRVNNDTSRTFILRIDETGNLELRHEITTEGEPSMYGGFAEESSTATKQIFRADEITVGIAPEAATNVWTMEFDLENNQFIYDLRRGDQQRFSGVFDITISLDQVR